MWPGMAPGHLSPFQFFRRYPMRVQPPYRTVAPATYPVTLDELKAHLRIDHDDEDAQLSSYIAAATARLDGWSGVMGRCLVSQTWVWRIEEFPGRKWLELPFPGVQSLTVAYYDPQNVLQTFASSNWQIVPGPVADMLMLEEFASWPSVADRPDAISITMVAGYGAAADVPADVRQAVLMMAAGFYEFREDVQSGQLDVLPMGAMDLIQPHRVIRF